MVRPGLNIGCTHTYFQNVQFFLNQKQQTVAYENHNLVYETAR